MKTKSLTTLAALIVIGAGGFMAGRISSPDADSSAGSDGPLATKSSRSASQSPADVPGKAAVRPGRPDRDSATTPEERLARLEAIVRGENPLDRSRALLAFIDQLGPNDFEEAIASFRSLGITGSRMSEYALLLSAWAKVDPYSALAYATTNTGGNFASNTILTTWAASDPEGAIRWAETQYKGDGANPHLAGIIRSLGATDPARATELLTGMPRSNERGEALDAMLPHLLVQGNEATRAWIEGLDDAALRNGAMMRAAENLATTDPAGTAAWLLANPSEATQRRMDDVYSEWAKTDQQAALASLSTLPAGEERSNALRGVINRIADEDPAAAISMMDRFPTDVSDRTVQQVVWRSLGDDPAMAVGQISRISDEGRRNWTYNRILENWFERDAAAAANWVQTNPLPESVQQRFLERTN